MRDTADGFGLLQPRRGPTSGCTGAGAHECSLFVQRACAGPVNLIVRPLIANNPLIKCIETIYKVSYYMTEKTERDCEGRHNEIKEKK